MAQQIIQTGLTANDGRGDTLRQAGSKINDNFTELYLSRNSSNYSLPTASPTELGGVRIGTGLTILNGVLNAIPGAYSLPIASMTELGGIKVDGTSITINPSTGVISGANTYVLPTATTSVLGGVKVDGTTITISNGVISSASGASVTTSSTAPLVPTTGDLWYDTTSGRMYVYFDSSWVDSSPVVAETISLTVLQQIVAASTDFADFQIRIAAL